MRPPDINPLSAELHRCIARPFQTACSRRGRGPRNGNPLDHLAGAVAIKSLHITIVMQRFISEISS